MGTKRRGAQVAFYWIDVILSGPGPYCADLNQAPLGLCNIGSMTSNSPVPGSEGICLTLRRNQNEAYQIVAMLNEGTYSRIGGGAWRK